MIIVDGSLADRLILAPLQNFISKPEQVRITEESCDELRHVPPGHDVQEDVPRCPQMFPLHELSDVFPDQRHRDDVTSLLKSCSVMYPLPHLRPEYLQL